jgi:N-acetyl sugar amidotransferase
MRLIMLHGFANRAKKQAEKLDTYDAVLGVSGGKDSLFTALYAKEVLGLNCLLVSAYPDQITEIGEHNFKNLINKGFDCIRIYTDPNLVKALMKRDFFKYCHFRKANEYPLWASTFRVAKEKNIPLVIQGENAALTLGISENMNTDWDASTIYKTNTLGGETAYEHFSEIENNKLLTFQFPDLSNWHGKAIWLNYFVKEYSASHNAKFAIKRGLKVREDPLRDIGRIYHHTCLDSDFHIVSQYHKYKKLGFGFATDEVCNAIRAGVVNREAGFELIAQYDGKCADKYIQKFCDFIGITREEHDAVVERFTNKQLTNDK